MNEKNKNIDNFSIPTVNDNNSVNAGEIKINNNVVANIARLSALEVPGVLDIASSNTAESIVRMFTKRFEKGIKVVEDEACNYIIDIPVVLSLGVELAKIAIEIQQNVSKQVTKMTMKEVSKVNVIIDSVRNIKTEEKSTANTDYARN